MAKSINLFLLLFGSFLCLYTSNGGFYVSRAIAKTTTPQVQIRLITKQSNPIRDQLRIIYTREIGVREKTNMNDGERIAEYLKYTGLNEGYAWCAAFVSWSFGQAGLHEPKTAWSPSLFPNKRIVWQKDKSSSTPMHGDIFGIYYSNLKRIAHAGFVDEWGDKYVITVEGNTNDTGSREGDGVYRKRRPISSIYQVADWTTKP